MIKETLNPLIYIMLSKFQKLKNGVRFNKTQKPSDSQELQEQQKPILDDLDLKTTIQYFHELKDNTDDKELNKYTLQVNTFLKQQKVETKGSNIKLPISSFSKLRSTYSLHQDLIASLVQNFGFMDLTPIQSLSIPNVLQRRNVVCIAPTGSGKTLAYLLPIVQMLLEKPDQKALVVAPTFELSVQIYKVCLKLIGKQNPIGGLKIGHIQKLESKITDYDLIVTTPNKIIEILEKAGDKPELNYNHVVLDEADKYFELSFMDQLEKLLQLMKANERQYLLFSATYPQAIEKTISNIFLDRVEIVVGGRVRVLNSIDQKLSYVSTEEGKIIELENIVNNGELKIPCLMFVQSKERVREVYSILRKFKIHADYLAGNLSLNQREKKLKDFEDGKIWVLITTDLLARGVDFPELKLVINFDFPTSIVTYIHRVGRTGRANRKGSAITFFTNEDKFALRRLADLLKSSGCNPPEWIFKLPKPGKKEIKQMEKNPVHRESLIASKNRKKDKEFYNDIRKKDYYFLKKHEEENGTPTEKDQEKSNEWQTAE